MSAVIFLLIIIFSFLHQGAGATSRSATATANVGLVASRIEVLVQLAMREQLEELLGRIPSETDHLLYQLHGSLRRQRSSSTSSFVEVLTDPDEGYAVICVPSTVNQSL